MSQLIEATEKPEHPLDQKRRVGRPRGSGKKLPEFRNWNPKTWKLEYDIIIFLHCQGKTNREIAELQDYGEVQIGNIINCKLGQDKIQEIRLNISAGKTLAEKYQFILEQATSRVVEFVSKKETFEASPIAATGVALRAMEMIDKNLKTVSNVTNNTLVLASEASVDRLSKAMQKSQEATLLHGGEQKPLDIANRVGVVETTSRK